MMTENKPYDLIFQSMGEKILRIWTLPIFRVQMGIMMGIKKRNGLLNQVRTVNSIWLSTI